MGCDVVSVVEGMSGRMLQLKAPVRVSDFLQAFPHHVVCPVEEEEPIRPLPPTSTLQLGSLYLLRPSPPLKRLLSDQGFSPPLSSGNVSPLSKRKPLQQHWAC